MSKSRNQSSIPAFLQKTYDILENTALFDIVSWNEEGTGFLVKNVLAFQDQVLPMYFKHRNFASFVRQMNMYGFHKTRSDYKENEFVHPYFKKDQRQLLKKITRKSGDNHEEQYALMELKPHRTNNSAEFADMINKHNELEKICKILIDQNNKILQCNQQLRQQLLQQEQKGRKKIQKLQEYLLNNEDEELPYYLQNNDHKRKQRKILNIIQSEEEEDNDVDLKQSKLIKQDDSDSTIEKRNHQFMLTNGEPQLMLTNEIQEPTQESKIYLQESDVENPFIPHSFDPVQEYEELYFE